MPKELIALEPRKPVMREYEEPELRLRQLRIRTEFASPKHGTEMVGYRNEPSARMAYDPECYLCPGNSRAGGVVNPNYTGTFVFAS